MEEEDFELSLELCSKHDCTEPAVLGVLFLTDDGIMGNPFCVTHMTTAVEIISAMQDKLISMNLFEDLNNDNEN